MNGKSITTNVRAFNIRHGDLTLKNGTLNANFTGANSAVAVYGSTNSSDANYSKFTLQSTATINAPNGYGAMIGANSGAAFGAVVTISGTINSKYGVYVNGNIAQTDSANAAKFNVYGTVIASSENAAVYGAGYANWTFGTTSASSAPAVLTGGSGIYVKSGNVTINKANITANGEKTDYKFNTNGAEATGDAIIIDSCGYPGSVPAVTIKGGTITSANGAAVASYTKQDDPLYPTADFPRVDEVIPATSTAVFSSDVSDLAEDGYVTVYDEAKGGYVVEEVTDGYYLTVGSKIDVNFTINAENYDAEGGKIVVEGVDANLESPEKFEKTYDIASLPTVSGGAYDGNVIVTLDVAPAQIAETFTLKIYDSSDVLKNTIEASVYDYAQALLNDNVYGELMGSLIDYGALAAEYFNYNGAQITPSADYKTALSADEKGELLNRRFASLTQGEATFDGMVFFAKVEPEFKFYFEGVSVYEADLEGEGLNTVLTRTEEGMAVKVSGFKATDFGKNFTITVDGTALTINGYAYIASALKNDNLSALATGLFRYAQAAEAVA